RSALPAMPVELVLLPAWFPLNIYAMSSWARETVVPLTVLMALEPLVSIPPEARVDELWVKPPTARDLGFPRSAHRASLLSSLSWRNFFLAVDRGLRFLGRSPWKPLRARALLRAQQWILEHQDRNGGWGGIQPPMLNCVMALKALGFSDDHLAV